MTLPTGRFRVGRSCFLVSSPPLRPRKGAYGARLPNSLSVLLWGVGVYMIASVVLSVGALIAAMHIIRAL